ncbi:predicted protein [Naegleria gruberi]|uniref:N-acetylglucosaminylphosphatidylinositol deacetylase n=1 Tax=Naegleria gruberi TaxID=5762 RepID=D2VCX7_NAEGR|nr:uncharacterized protein NAEGRDRAFT_33046 [Naegleria gruberi]EFC45500.1 predicted protein [Naegleria gruberi]|eukprot:XP_002678244.1 predicted protein [Naegleria gruberi strain NEG-M]
MKRKYSKETILSKFLNQTQQQTNETSNNRKKVALVIAHPDDEAMFFSPMLLSLVEQQVSVSILCLSNGNFDGLGEKRVKELELSCSSMGLNCNNAKVVKELQDDLSGSLVIVDNDQLLDGMNNKWSDELISNFVAKFVEQNGITTLLTFDKDGISSHPNHIDVFRGVSYFSDRCKREQTSIDIFTLESVNLLRKYLGIIEFAISLHFNSDENVTIFTPNPFIAWKAMSSHESQFVWFRKLFVLFSRYTFVNTLTKL